MSTVVRTFLVDFANIRNSLLDCPKNIAELSRDLGLSYNRTYRTVNELIRLNKIKDCIYDDRNLLMWNEEVKFVYESSADLNIDEQFVKFECKPSKYMQMKLPVFVIQELGKKVGELQSDFKVILEIKAIKNNDKWYKINYKKGETK